MAPGKWVTKDVPLNPDHAFRLLEPVLYEQDGFATARQAELVGCPRSALAHLVRLGRMERVRKGVFRSSWGAPVMPRVEGELYADFLLLDGGRLPWDRREAIIVVSHASAARMLRIGVLPADRHEFTSPVRRSTSQPTIELRVAQLIPRDWEWMVDGRIAVTRAERTIVDLALTGTSRDYLRRALRDARRRDLLDEDELARVIDRRIVSANRSSIVWLRDELQAGG